MPTKFVATAAIVVTLRAMKILKFGGSSLATPHCVRNVAKIVLQEARRGPVIVVLSAFQGVTNQLLDCARLAEKGDRRYDVAWKKIAGRHRSAVDSLVGRRRGIRIRSQVDALLGDLHDALHGVQLLGHSPPRALDLIVSFGERLGALIVAAHLARVHPARFVDARQLVVTDNQFTNANVIFSKTNRAARRYFADLFRLRRRRPIPVVTGFIGSTSDGQTTTIGRNGSDYTAAILGAALGASVIEIWTDVDGVLSADPKAVTHAFVLPQITYEEAMELSYFGAKVLHPAAIAPAVARRIPLLIKNTFHPEAPGTLISGNRGDGDQLAKGISSIAGLTLLTIRGLTMVGVPGIAERLFRALASRSINVILISQASSEHTICFAVRQDDTPLAIAAVRHEFRFEFQNHLTSLDEKPDQAIVAVVGDEMKGHAGVSGKVFGALGRHNINISAIAQGASERNISCVIDAAQQARALNIIHQAFFEVRKRLALVVIGVGNIGGTLLRQLYEQRAYLLARGFDVTVVGVANSKWFALEGNGINLARWRERLSASRRRMDPQVLAREIAKLELTDAAIVDCTAADSIVKAYPDFVRANLHIITPNKRANVLPWRQYAALMELLRKRQKYFLDEANVGAGLPIMSTLRDLIASGDVIRKVEGIFSGTLSYLFNSFDGSMPFSALVRKAYQTGLTEPDPRDDLSGQDVARKLLILARQSGSKLEITDVDIESLVPRNLAAGLFSQRFFTSFARLDSQMAERLKRVDSRGAVLRYVGTLERGRARAGIKEFPRDHPIAATKGSDNIIAFTTKRYSRTPLVVQGPGAGADVTAMGVFSDILKLLNYLPH
jgi:aspartokinase/homoserine dehydrogenase 1